ncbi:Quinate O-hydroxycinnamoyltransferase [Bertholletia excelsa]
MSPTTTVRRISECFVQPKDAETVQKKPIYLSPWDLAMLSVHYIQKGLLFIKPLTADGEEDSVNSLLERLKESLSVALVHFYPLAGRLATLKEENPNCYSVYIDCNNSPGARFIHTAVDLSISDILSPLDVPPIVQSFFDHDRAVNHDGHIASLLTIQVTELVDGIFIGCSINHMVADGTSYWHFFNTFSKIFKEEGKSGPLSKLPIHQHWLPGGYGPILNLPFTHHDQFVSRHEAPPLRERIFRFSSKAIARIKSKANADCNSTNISSLQALSAFMWRCVTRVRRFPYDQQTSCRLAINNRSRLVPPLPAEYFGNCIQTVKGTVAAGELLAHNLGWAAALLHRAVVEHNDMAIRQWVDSWLQSPFIYQLGQFFDPCSIMMGSSPRFDMYGNEFGMGRAVAVLSGYANKFDGKVTLYPGSEGGGSWDLEVCLSPESMAAIESDEEFVSALHVYDEIARDKTSVIGAN